MYTKIIELLLEVVCHGTDANGLRLDSCCIISGEKNTLSENDDFGVKIEFNCCYLYSFEC